MVYTKINGECWDCPEGKTCPLGLTCCCNNGVITKSAGSANDYFLRSFPFNGEHKIKLNNSTSLK